MTTRGLLLALLLLLSSSGSQAQTGEIRGRLQLDVEGTTLSNLGATAVYLESLDGASFDLARGRAVVTQKNAKFDPDFLVIPAGQTVDMPNGDVFYHNVFSYSRPNEFDLGLYPMGESRFITFRHPGVVRIYCSIHETMRGVILVAPSPWFATVRADGAFHITDIPPGRYRLATFSEPLPSVVREVVVEAGRVSAVEIQLQPGV